MLNNVLFISSTFPPMNKMSALRSGKHAKYLPDFGWNPIILTIANLPGTINGLPLEIAESKINRVNAYALTTLITRNLQKHLPANKADVSRKEKTVKSSSVSKWKIGSSLRSVPVLNYIYEPTGWYFDALEKGLELVSNNKIDIIFSTQPHKIGHFIAAELSKRTGIPWIAEYRDHWSLNPYIKDKPFFSRLDRYIEKKIISKAKAIVAVTPTMAEELKDIHSKEVELIYNGFDEEEYYETVPLLSKFTITYTGSIYPGKREPDLLFEVLSILRKQGLITAHDINVNFLGSNLSKILDPVIQQYELNDIVNIDELIPFQESLKRQRQSTILLLLGWNNIKDKGVLTGKIFEYMGSSRPILAIGYKNGDMAKILRQTGTGILVDNINELIEILKTWISEFKEYGSISSYYRPDKEFIKQFTRKNQASQLAHLFNRYIKEE